VTREAAEAEYVRLTRSITTRLDTIAKQASELPSAERLRLEADLALIQSALAVANRLEVIEYVARELNARLHQIYSGLDQLNGSVHEIAIR